MPSAACDWRRTAHRSTTIWDTDTDFNTGVSYQSQLFPPVGVSTLHTSGTGAAATLTLPSTPLPLAQDAADPVLGPTASTVGDGDNVDDPTVVKVGTTYDMWYTGYRRGRKRARDLPRDLGRRSQLGARQQR